MELKFKKGGRVATITLDGDNGNIFSEDFITKLREFFRIADSSEAKIIEISSGNRAYFSKGPDLFSLDKQNMELSQASDLLRRLANELNSFILDLASSDKLVITLFNGAIFGGGLNIFLGSDFSQFGLTLDLSASYFFQKFMSLTEVQKILYEDNFIDAKRARKLGIFHECFETLKDLKEQLENIESWDDRKITTVVHSNKLMIDTEKLRRQLSLETDLLIESFELGGNDFGFN